VKRVIIQNGQMERQVAWESAKGLYKAAVLRSGRSMFQNNGIAGGNGPKFLVGIDLETVPGQGPYFVILVLEVDGAVVILKSPLEGEGIGTSCAIFAKNDGVVLFRSCYARVEGVEDPVIIGAEAGFFIFPGITGEQFHVVAGRAFGRTAYYGEAG
jgi:hypothetical protein